MPDDAEELVRAEREAAAAEVAELRVKLVELRKRSGLQASHEATLVILAGLLENEGFSRDGALAEACRRLTPPQEPQEAVARPWGSPEGALAKAQELLGADLFDSALRALRAEKCRQRRDADLLVLCRLVRRVAPKLEELRDAVDSAWGFKPDSSPQRPADIRSAIAEAHEEPMGHAARRFFENLKSWAEAGEPLVKEAFRLRPTRAAKSNKETAAYAAALEGLTIDNERVSPGAAAYLEIAVETCPPCTSEQEFERLAEKWKKALKRGRVTR